MADDIMKLIDKAVEEKTFSLDALGAVQKIKETAGILQARVDQLTKDLEESRKIQENIRLAHKAAEEKLSASMQRETAIFEREKNMVNLEKEQAISFAVRTAYEKMFDKIFANRQFRENVVENNQKSYQPSGAMSYPVTMPENSNRTKTIEEG